MPSRSAYLITNVPEELRAALSGAARARNCSLADYMRSVLGARYGLSERRTGRRYQERLDHGARQIQLRASPELFAAIKSEASVSGTTMRSIMLDALEASVLGALEKGQRDGDDDVRRTA